MKKYRVFQIGFMLFFISTAVYSDPETNEFACVAPPPGCPDDDDCSIPDAGWATVFSELDCFGVAAQGTVGCYDYGADLYENIDYTGASPTTVDLKSISTGYDLYFYYLQYDFVNDWNVIDSSQHFTITEIDIDPATEIPNKGDYYLSIQMKNKFNSTAWVVADDGVDYTLYYDTDNDIGTGSLSNGYETLADLEDDQVWARVFNGNFQIAINIDETFEDIEVPGAEGEEEEEVGELDGPSPVFFRLTSSQSMNIPNDQLAYNDHHLLATVTNIDNVIRVQSGTNCNPVLTVNKVANPTTIDPQGIVTYTVTITNSGVDSATNVIVDDTLGRYSAWDVSNTFLFAEGVVPSTLTLGTPTYSNDNGVNYIYTPVSGGGGASVGFDASVTHWKIPMVGTMAISGSFSLSYQLKIN